MLPELIKSNTIKQRSKLQSKIGGGADLRDEEREPQTALTSIIRSDTRDP